MGQGAHLSQEGRTLRGTFFKVCGMEQEVFDISACPEPPHCVTLEEAECTHILTVLESTGWRVSGAHGTAEILGLKPTTLESRMKKLGIMRPA